MAYEADDVSRQYERWQYPAPISDLEQWSARNWEWFDPRHAQRLLWPHRPYRDGMEILIAGCGPNQAAVFAHHNPTAKVVALDVSRAALDHHYALKKKYGLANLDLYRLPVEEAPKLDRQFDLIVSTGVLHHLVDPARGMSALAGCLRPDGVLGVMVYARYGRLGVVMLQSVFRDLGLGQDEASIRKARMTMSLLPSAHPAAAYLQLAPDLNTDGALVDTFLHPRERSYTVGDCLELVSSAGLVFQDWLIRSPYYLHDLYAPVNELSDAVNALPPATHWSVMERLQATNACHFFMACRPDRDHAQYRIDFTAPESIDFVPEWRLHCGVSGDQIVSPNLRRTLEGTQAALVRLVDGRRTIGEIADGAGSDAVTDTQEGNTQMDARQLFESLWRLDFVAMGLR
jgi:SAM-dependent methyltransferase